MDITSLDLTTIFSTPVGISAAALLIVQQLKRSDESGQKTLLFGIPASYTPVVVLAISCALSALGFAIDDVLWKDAVKNAIYSWLIPMGAYSGGKTMMKAIPSKAPETTEVVAPPVETVDAQGGPRDWPEEEAEQM